MSRTEIFRHLRGFVGMLAFFSLVALMIVASCLALSSAVFFVMNLWAQALHLDSGGTAGLTLTPSICIFIAAVFGGVAMMAQYLEENW